MTNTGRQTKKVKQKTVEKVFQEINRKYVRIKKRERKNNNEVLSIVLEELLKRMRKCETLFDSMNPRLEYLGSYFDGLRVGQPTEYDINVVLTIHVNYKKIILLSTKNAYTSIVMPKEFRRLSKTPNTINKGFDKTQFWCDNSFRLQNEKFRSWMQRVMDSALTQLPIQDGKRILEVKGKIYKLQYKMSGPANTITIYLNDDYNIDVDLVPTLQFKLPKIPIGTNIDFDKVKRTNISYYFAVPKPNDDSSSWRLAFPYQEQVYMDDKNNFKSTLKLIKLFRDVQGFDKLASYFIKTLFLWEIEENKDEHFWSKNSLTFLVLYMLDKLKDSLAVATIKNFWCPKHNLLENVKVSTCHTWANRISNVIKDISHNKSRNPSVVLKYFTKPVSSSQPENVHFCRSSSANFKSF